MSALEKMPLKRFEQVASYELWDVDELPEEERIAVLAAMAEYRKSTNPEFRAGAVAVAEDGTMVAKHNESNEVGKGQEGHAEMLAIAALFRAVNPSERKLKMLSLAATSPDEELIRVHERYDASTELNDMEGERVCGRCLKFIADYTGDFVSSQTGKNDDKNDVTILTVLATGQVLRTSLRTLHPMPHRPRHIPLKPLQQNISSSPDTYSNGK